MIMTLSGQREPGVELMKGDTAVAVWMGDISVMLLIYASLSMADSFVPMENARACP